MGPTDCTRIHRRVHRRIHRRLHRRIHRRIHRRCMMVSPRQRTVQGVHRDRGRLEFRVILRKMFGLIVRNWNRKVLPLRQWRSFVLGAFGRACHDGAYGMGPALWALFHRDYGICPSPRILPWLPAPAPHACSSGHLEPHVRPPADCDIHWSPIPPHPHGSAGFSSCGCRREYLADDDTDDGDDVVCESLATTVAFTTTVVFCLIEHKAGCNVALS